MGLAVLTAAGLDRLLPGRQQLTPLVVLAGALLLQTAALLAVCTYYWLPRRVAFTPTRLPDVVAWIARWSPFPVGLTLTVLTLTGLLAVAALTQTLHLRPRTAHTHQ